MLASLLSLMGDLSLISGNCHGRRRELSAGCQLLLSLLLSLSFSRSLLLLRIKLKASAMLGKFSTAEPHLQLFFCFVLFYVEVEEASKEAAGSTGRSLLSAFPPHGLGKVRPF